MDEKHVVIDFIDTEYDEKLNDELMQWKNNNVVYHEYESSIQSLSRSNSDSDHSGSQYSRNSSVNRQKIDADNAMFHLFTKYSNCKKSMYMHIHHVGKVRTIILFGSSSLITISSIAIAPSFVETEWVVFFLIIMNLLSFSILSTLIFTNIYTNSLLALNLANAYEKMATEIENMEGNHNYGNKLSNIEYKMNELSTSFEIYAPMHVKKCHRIVYYMNVFDVIKKIKTCKKRISLKMSTIHRELTRFMKSTNSDLSSGDKNQIHYLGGMKEGTKKEKTDAESAFTYLCELLTMEQIRANEHFETYKWLYTSPPAFVGHAKSNPLIDEYLQSIHQP